MKFEDVHIPRMVWAVVGGEVRPWRMAFARGNFLGPAAWVGEVTPGKWVVWTHPFRSEIYPSEEVAIAAAVMLTSLDNNT